jgi:hypothetical protein
MPSSGKKDAAEELIQEYKREKSLFYKIFRKLQFLLGFSQCRYCVYCETDGGSYKGMRESMLLNQGLCKWSGGAASGHLDYDDLRKFHRCPAFTQVLFNFKDYAINPNEVEKIHSKRRQSNITWAGWAVAALITLLSGILD